MIKFGDLRKDNGEDGMMCSDDSRSAFKTFKEKRTSSRVEWMETNLGDVGIWKHCWLKVDVDDEWKIIAAEFGSDDEECGRKANKADGNHEWKALGIFMAWTPSIFILYDHILNQGMQ